MRTPMAANAARPSLKSHFPVSLCDPQAPSFVVRVGLIRFVARGGTVKCSVYIDIILVRDAEIGARKLRWRNQPDGPKQSMARPATSIRRRDIHLVRVVSGAGWRGAGRRGFSSEALACGGGTRLAKPYATRPFNGLPIPHATVLRTCPIMPGVAAAGLRNQLPPLVAPGTGRGGQAHRWRMCGRAARATFCHRHPSACGGWPIS